MLPEDPKVLVIDTETTGMGEQADIVEIAAIDVSVLDGGWEHCESLCKPKCPIEIEAMAVHHITETMVQDKQDPQAVIRQFYIDTADVYVAHNAEFDKKFLEPYVTEKPWICTWRCAMNIWPDAPGHSNQVLRYFLFPDAPIISGSANKGPHRAFFDAYTTAILYEQMRMGYSVEELIYMTSQPIMLRKIRFGKHRGELFEKLPRDYLQWIVRQKDMDADVQHTARHLLGRR